MSGFGNSTLNAGESLDKLDRGLLAMTLVVAPLFMGGRHPVGRLVLISLIGLQTVIWMWRQADRHDASWRRSALTPLWLAAIGWVSLQLTPLPQSLLSQLSPHVGENLPLWTATHAAAIGLGQWQTVSLTPVATLRGLILLVAYGLLFLVTLQRIRGWDDIRRIFHLMIVAGGVMALVAVCQRFAGNGKFLWIYDHPFRNASHAVKGAFINENHLCGFLALVAPVALHGWIFAKSAQSSSGFSSRVRTDSSWTATPRLWLIILGMLIATTLLSFSRGGIMAMGAAMLAGVALLAHSGGIERRQLRSLLGVGGVIVVVLSVYGATPLSRQLQTLNGNMQDMSSARAALWKAVGTAIPNYLRSGAGVGAHRYVYPQHMPLQLDVELTHAENGYLQVLLETGAPGFLMLMTGWAVIMAAAWRVLRHGDSPRKRGVGAVVLAASTASLLHSFVDFVWYIPACMTLTLVLAAVGIRASQLVMEESQQEPAQSRAFPRGAWRLGALGTAAVAGWMVCVSLPPARASQHWDRYLRLSLEAKKRPSTLKDRTLVETMVEHLQRAVDADPQRARPQLRLASMRLKLFELLQEESENPMPLAQLREAAAASRDAFGTFEKQQAWLQRAVGENLANAQAARTHALNTLQQCPLQGEAYVLVAETEMLARLEDHRTALLQQALKLRPYSGSILFAVGSHFAMHGDVDRAMRFYRTAFHRQPEIRRVLLASLSTQIPADQLLNQLRPTPDMLPQVRTAYVQSERPEDAAAIAEYIARFAEDAARKGDEGAWKQALEAWVWAGNEPRGAMCGLQAVKMEPGNYNIRKQLGICFYRLGKIEQAQQHLSWCRQRNPEDEDVARLYAESRPTRSQLIR